MVATKLIIWALISVCFGSFSSLALSEEFLFSPNGSQFSVMFPGKPVITKYHTAQGDDCVTHNAMLKMLDGEAGLRAEATVCSNTNTPNFNEHDILKGLRHHAEISGVTEAIFQAEKTPIGYVGMYRGVLASIGNTFVYVSIIGEKSGLALVGSAPYNDYPGIGFEKFKGSIRKLETNSQTSSAEVDPFTKKMANARPTFKVDVSVTGSDIKTLAESYLRRELRQLDDVVITEENPSKVISMIIIDIAYTDGEQLGYAIALQVENPTNKGTVEGLVTRGTSIEDLWFYLAERSEVLSFSLQTTTRSALQADIAEIVADFDIELLEPTRQMFRRIREENRMLLSQ